MTRIAIGALAVLLALFPPVGAAAADGEHPAAEQSGVARYQVVVDGMS
jgi:hypothetical protein